MKQTINYATIVISILLFVMMISARYSWAFRVPQETQEEALRVQINNLSDSVRAERTAIIIILVILLLSVATNVLLILSQWRIQRQVSESLDAIRSVNIIKETAARFSVERARRIPGSSDDREDAEDIQILRSGF